MNRAEYAPTAPPGYATVGSELTEMDNESPLRVFKFSTPKKIRPTLSFSGGTYAMRLSHYYGGVFQITTETI